MEFKDVWILAHKKNLNLKMAEIKELISVQDVQVFCPIKEYFLKLRACSPEYLNHFYAMIKWADPNKKEYNEKHFTKWLLRRHASIFEEEIVNKNALTLLSKKQGVGKTILATWLTPPELKEYHSSDFSGPKKQLLLGKSITIVMDDLQPERTKCPHLKKAMSLPSVQEWISYKSKTERLPRIASFIITSDEVRILKCKKAQRFVCLEIDSIDFDYKNIETGEEKIDIKKVLGAIKYLYQNGEKGFINKAEMEEMMQNNKQFWHESILDLPKKKRKIKKREEEEFDDDDDDDDEDDDDKNSFEGSPNFLRGEEKQIEVRENLISNKWMIRILSFLAAAGVIPILLLMKK